MKRVALALVALTFTLPATARAQAPLAPAADAPKHAQPAGVAQEAISFSGGLSGSLRAVILPMQSALDLPVGEEIGAPGTYRWEPLHGTPPEPLAGYASLLGGLAAPAAPGIWRLRLGEDEAPLTIITQVPFSRKQGGVLNGYRIGRYPTEGSARNDRYAPPAGFIEVTPENQDFHISEHFQLRQFLTKDQFDVWPKYLVLDLRLIDKLELVLQELNAMGVRADRMHVMSGFRTPQYNGPGGDGRAALSRHMYGDAADVWVDNDANGYMDDLNGDDRIDLDDAAVILKAVERVERRHPELIGGSGLYVEMGPRGPFIHIDVRGSHSRW